MNNRIQVGGLALIIKGRIDNRNVGKQVVLTRKVGKCYGGIHDCWEIYCEDGLGMSTCGDVKEAIIEEYRLMPLGDKQTQDEFRQEEEYNDGII